MEALGMVQGGMKPPQHGEGVKLAQAGGSSSSRHAARLIQANILVL